MNLKAIKGLLRKKGTGATKSKGSGKNDKKTAMFAEAASKEVPQKSEPAVKYNNCVVSFAIQVGKMNNAKAGFDKKIVAALSFIQLILTSMQPSSLLRGWIQINIPSKKRQIYIYQSSKLYCAVISRSLIKRPLIV